MKKLLLVALLAIGVSAVSFAQGFQRQTPEEQVAAQKTALKLTDAQGAKLLPILAAQAKSTDSLFQSGGGMGGGGDFQAMFKKMDAINDGYNAKIKAILTTPEQADLFKKQLEARAEQRKQMMQNMPQN